MSQRDDTWSLHRSAISERPGRAHLLVVDGTTSSRFDLPETGTLVVGRAAEADLQIHDKSVSRRHAQLFVGGGEVRIADLGSHNGVRVNGEPIAETRTLDSGDVVSMGEVTLVLYIEAPGPVAMPMLGANLLRQRLAEEIARALEYERPLTLLAFSFGNAEVARADVARALAGKLRLIDLAGWSDEAQLLILVPELGPSAVASLVERLLAALAKVAPSVKVGRASCPADGCDVPTLLAAARAAVGAAEPGRVAEAGQLVTELKLGERSVLVADPAMARLYELIKRLAASELPVLISGETGVGKENAAFAVHHWSRRAERPFVAINCAAIPEALVESELFGHEKGAFTGAAAAKPGLFEVAAGGTVFLDELAELPAAAQAKLLRALETRRIVRVGGLNEREIDIRVVAATHRKLPDEVAAGRFRNDLYFRLCGATVVLPPLRERPRDVVLLAQRFLAAARGDKPPMTLAPATLAALGRYGWPGNVRELKNAMEYVAAAVPDDVVEPWHLPEQLTAALEGKAPEAPEAGAAPERPPRKFRPIAEELREIERERMMEALSATLGVKARAAERIGMPIRTFTLKCKQYGL